MSYGEIVKEWQDIAKYAQQPNVFFNPEIANSWIRTYRCLRKIEPVFVRAISSNGNIAFLPMVLWYRNWKNAFVKTIIPVGYSDFDYHDPIFSKKTSDAEYDSFWEELLYRLEGFGADEICTDGVRHSNDSGIWEKGEICPFLELRNLDSEEDLLKFLKTSLRGDIRRQIRRINEIGELSLKHYNSWEEASATFDKFITEHSLRWPNAYKAPEFHKHLLQDGLPSGLVDFSSLNAGNQPIAWHLGFHHNGHFYYYMPCGDHKFSQYSPVKVHLFKLISNSIQQGDILFDHLRGDETYKGGWSNGSRHVYNRRIVNNRISSKLKFAMTNIAHRIR